MRSAASLHEIGLEMIAAAILYSVGSAFDLPEFSGGNSRGLFETADEVCVVVKTGTKACFRNACAFLKEKLRTADLSIQKVGAQGHTGVKLKL